MYLLLRYISVLGIWQRICEQAFSDWKQVKSSGHCLWKPSLQSGLALDNWLNSKKLGCPFFTHPILALINNRRSHGGGVWVSSNSNMKPGVIPSCHFPFKRHFFPIGNPHYPLPPSWDPLAVTDRQRMKKPLSLLKYSHWYRSQSKSWHLDSTTPGNASPRAVLNARNTGMPGHLLRKACFLLSSFLLILFSLLLVKNNVFFLILKVYIHCRKNQKVKINNICKHF